MESLEEFFTMYFCPSQSMPRTYRPNPFLLYFGPSGSGKNSTVDFLCMKYDIEKVYPRDIVLEENSEYSNYDEINFGKDLLKAFHYSCFWGSSM